MGDLPKATLSPNDVQARALFIIGFLDGLTLVDVDNVVSEVRLLLRQTHRVDASACKEQFEEFAQSQEYPS